MKPDSEQSWKEIFANEVRPLISDNDWQRVCFLGKVDYAVFVSLLQLSTVHIYLTYPFVLSWSLLEAMSVGCAIVASDTQPLQEVIEHDVNGRLVSFFDIKAITDQVCELLDDEAARQRLGASAREFVVANYDLRTVCLPKQIEWVLS
jgi:glycosyltransferase involved in cell wall biosynthesis